MLKHSIIVTLLAGFALGQGTLTSRTTCRPGAGLLTPGGCTAPMVALSGTLVAQVN